MFVVLRKQLFLCFISVVVSFFNFVLFVFGCLWYFVGFLCCRWFVYVWGVVFCLLELGVGLCFMIFVGVCALEIAFVHCFVVFWFGRSACSCWFVDCFLWFMVVLVLWVYEVDEGVWFVWVYILLFALLCFCMFCSWYRFWAGFFFFCCVF